MKTRLALLFLFLFFASVCHASDILPFNIGEPESSVNRKIKQLNLKELAREERRMGGSESHRLLGIVCSGMIADTQCEVIVTLYQGRLCKVDIAYIGCTEQKLKQLTERLFKQFGKPLNYPNNDLYTRQWSNGNIVVDLSPSSLSAGEKDDVFLEISDRKAVSLLIEDQKRLEQKKR